MIISYNDKAGIQALIGSVKNFMKLIESRREAYADKDSYPNRPDLDVFIVQKKWYFDQFGQVGYLSEFHTNDYKDITEKIRGELDDVMTLVEFREAMEKHQAGYTIVLGGLGPMPKAYSKCACCGEFWTMQNLDDYKTTFESIPASDLKQVIGQGGYDKLVSMLDANTTLRIEQYPIALLENGLNNLTGFTWKIIEENGTISFYNYTSHYHSACHLKMIEEKTKSEIINAIKAADFTIIGMIRTKNRYGSQVYRGAWWLVETQYGVLRVGWRKSVIEVSYEFIDNHYLPITEETRGPGYEHVYGYQKLTEALITFKNHLDTKADFKINIPNLTSHQDDRK